jgi:Zn finger protein HypA/HybF involved in hydrogenase expression
MGMETMAALFGHKQAGTSRAKRTFQRGTIQCRKCGNPIHVYKLAGLPDEFSVQCRKCHDRRVYAKREVTIDELPDRRQKPR